MWAHLYGGGCTYFSYQDFTLEFDKLLADEQWNLNPNTICAFHQLCEL